MNLIDRCCCSLKKKVYRQTTPKFYVYGGLIPLLTSVNEALRYLGSMFTSERLTTCSIRSLDEQIGGIMRCPLKPQQKCDIVKSFLIPRCIHSLQSPSMAMKILKKADQMIRRAVEKILNLPIQIIDEALYTSVALGGLGLFSMSRKISRIMRGRMKEAAEASPFLGQQG